MWIGFFLSFIVPCVFLIKSNTPHREGLHLFSYMQESVCVCLWHFKIQTNTFHSWSFLFFSVSRRKYKVKDEIEMAERKWVSIIILGSSDLSYLIYVRFLCSHYNHNGNRVQKMVFFGQIYRVMNLQVENSTHVHKKKLQKYTDTHSFIRYAT